MDGLHDAIREFLIEHGVKFQQGDCPWCIDIQDQEKARKKEEARMLGLEGCGLIRRREDR